MAEIAVIGASGFVGSAVVQALSSRGHDARAVRAPRLRGSLSPTDPARAEASARLARDCTGVSAIVNCAGVAESTGTDEALHAANAVLPGIIAEVAESLEVRLVHVSSCAVQGRMPILDESEDTAPFSPYSRSKADGEAAVRGHARAVRYRPPGVHDETRDLTRSLARLAASPFATVAGRGDQPSAQAQLANVADAIAELATTGAEPPEIVLQPSEGLTTASLLTALGGRAPRRIPGRAASALSGLARAAGTRVPWVAGQSRRLDMLWWGQDQGSSWLTQHGWRPPRNYDGWLEMGAGIRADQERRIATRSTT